MKNPSSPKRFIMKPLNLNKMKKLILLIPFILFSCNKKETDITSTNVDSTIVRDGNIVENNLDSANNGIISIDESKPDQKEMAKTFRVIDGDSIIKTINGDMIPLKINDEFTTDQQKFILKIKNFDSKKISGTVASDNNDMNIRFNQIKLPSGEMDGPFGPEINYEVKEKGEVWLIIGKNLMASGNPKGKFTVTLK